MSLNIEDPDVWMRVHKKFLSTTREDERGCLLWVGAKTDDGYGSVKFDRVSYRAHRVSYQLAFGPFPQAEQVLHGCDIPLCVNPDHLRLGDVQSNMAEMRAKGRAWWQRERRGETPHVKRGRKPRA